MIATIPLRPASTPLIRLLLGLGFALAAAFSAAQSPPASSQSETSGASAIADTLVPGVDIALVLPLDSPSLERAADAVRAGFLAAAGAGGSGMRTQVFAHGADGVLAAVEAARASGAKVIVGPLARDDVNVVAQLATGLPLTIALNQLEEGVSAPSGFYTFALAVDSDARLIARRMRAEATRSAAVISAESAISRRMGTAFAAEWLARGGTAPGAFRFDAAPEALATLRRDFLRNAPDGVFVALDGAAVMLVKAYLGTVPAYASGLLFDQTMPAGARDLDGLVVVEIPWLATPDAPQFVDLPRREYPSAALERLYALGLDAFRISLAFRDGPPRNFVVDGATGRIALFDGHQLVREGRFVVYRNGEPVALDGAR